MKNKIYILYRMTNIENLVYDKKYIIRKKIIK